VRWSSRLWVVGFAGLVACTEPPHDRVYTVTFTNTETFTYGGPGCVGNPNTLYCGTWNPDVYEFVGTLTGNPATVLVIGTTQFTREPDWTPLSFRTSAASTGCHSIVLVGEQGNDFSGTWSETTDCHSAGRRGTFVAYRSDLPE
jgi:hypothetical protein